MKTSLNRFSGYQSGLARRGFDKKLPTFLDVSVKLFTILIPEAPKKIPFRAFFCSLIIQIAITMALI